MSEQLLNENLEETTTEETVVEDQVEETPVEEETTTPEEETPVEGEVTEEPVEGETTPEVVPEEDEIDPDFTLDDTTTEDEPIDEEMGVIPEEMPPQRVNDFCVVSKKTFGEYNVRNIETNSSWSSNPYGDDYAVVPDDMVPAIKETRGFCDIELNEDGTEIVSFKALEIPEIPVPEPEPSDKERIGVLEEEVTNTQLALVEQYETNLAMEDELTDTQMALVEQYEANLALETELETAQNELTDTQMALVEQYEANIELENRLAELEAKVAAMNDETTTE